jgi:cell wall-associated NlpC family hydrolase
MPKRPKRDDVKPPWWYTSASPQTLLHEAIKAPDTPGIEAVAGMPTPQAPLTMDAPDDEEPFLPPMTRQVWDNVFAPVEPAPTYGSDERGPAMRQEDITAVGGDRGKAVRLAKSFVGLPYIWGGTNPNQGFDCSGLVQYVYKQAFGINLPRVSYQQANSGRRVGLSALQPGDLVAWDNSARNNGADHVAIYLGGGQIVEAPRPGVPIRVRKLGKNEGAWGVRIL